MKFHKPKFVPFAAAASTSSSSPPTETRASKQHWSMMPAEKWRGMHLRDYFYMCYLKHVGVPHLYAERPHAGMMNKLVKRLDGPETVRLYIDTMFEMNRSTNTIEVFVSTQRLGEIREYLQKQPQLDDPLQLDVQPKVDLKTLLGGD